MYSFFFLILGFLGLGSSLGAQQIQWKYDPSLHSVAERFQTIAEEDYADALQTLGLTGSFPGEIILVGGREKLGETVQRKLPSWYAAYTLPGRRLICISTEAAGDASVFRTTLRHELMHLAMANWGEATFARVPRWLHEGMAQTFAGEVWLQDRSGSLVWRALFDQLPGLHEYQDGFGAEPLHAADGYALAFALVSRLQREYPPNFLARLYAVMGEGLSLDAALLHLTDLSLVTHEKNMREELQSLHAILQALLGHFVTLLFLLSLITVPWIILRRRRRRATLEEKWESEEEPLEGQSSLESL